MFQAGLTKEIEKLKAAGYKGDEPGLQAIGYREFFTGETDIEKIKQAVKHDTKRYAKRQETFFKSFDFAEILNPENINLIKEKILFFFNQYML